MALGCPSSVPTHKLLNMMFLNFKLVQIYENLNTIVEVKEGLKGLNRFSST